VASNPTTPVITSKGIKRWEEISARPKGEHPKRQGLSAVPEKKEIPERSFRGGGEKGITREAEILEQSAEYRAVILNIP